MIDPRRHLLGAGCFLLAVAALFLYDFDHRGRHLDGHAAHAKTDRAGVYDLSKARMLTRVVGHVRSHYVDPERVDPREMVVAALRAVQRTVPEVRVVVTRDSKERARTVEVGVASTTRRFGLERVSDLYELNWKLMDVFDFLERNLPVTTDVEDLEYTAVNGILSTLDPHSVLISPQAYREMQMGTQGRFGGLGIVVSVKDGALTVMSVMDSTPADRAGLQSGDQIAQIGEESTVNMALSEAVNRLRGEPGSDITIWIRRQGWAQPREFTLTREEIRLRSVVDHDLGQGIGYVKIRNFQGNTFDDLDESLAKLTSGGKTLKGLVLDLRNNPGGLLDQAIKISDRFIGDGTLVTTVRERGKEREERHATRAGTIETVPIVVLINRGSASASEIVAGALKHEDRALVIGTTSFGKGSVQVVYQLDDAALKLTIAQYLTPGDISIQSVGIVPDVEIESLDTRRSSLDLHPDERDVEGEAGLASHLESKKITAVRPAVRLKLLDDAATREAEGDEAAKEARGTGTEFESDTLIELARDLLVAAPTVGRRKALVQAKGFLDARQAAEDERVKLSLSTIGVDWARGETQARPSLDVELKVVPPKARAGQRARAGDEVSIVGRVTNRGRQDVWRLRGVVHSELRALQGEELVFGRIAPGESREWTTTVELPRSYAAQGDEVRLELYQADQSLGELARATVEVDALPEPRFAYVARVVDAEGSGDGLIQRGERVSVYVDVKNVGEGDADDVLVTVKNESGEAVFIEKGRHRVGKLAAGAVASARFTMTVKEGLKSQDVQLMLRIVDQGLRSWTQDELALPVFPQEFPAASPSHWMGEVEAGPVSLHAGAHQDTAVVARAQTGAVVPVVATAGEWVGVRLQGSEDGRAWGWVPASRLKKKVGASSRLDLVTPVVRHQPPRLDLPGLVDWPLITDAPTFSLKGSAHFEEASRGRRYVYIFRGQDKVYFQAGSAAEGPGDTLGFEAEIPLEPGRNELVFVAREGEDDVTRHSVAIYRTGGGDKGGRQ